MTFEENYMSESPSTKPLDQDCSASQSEKNSPTASIADPDILSVKPNAQGDQKPSPSDPNETLGPSPKSAATQRSGEKGKREKRTERIEICLSPTEKAEAERRANGKSVSGFVRAFLLGTSPEEVKPGPKRRGTMSQYENEKIRQMVTWNALLRTIAKAAPVADSATIQNDIQALKMLMEASFQNDC